MVRSYVCLLLKRDNLANVEWRWEEFCRMQRQSVMTYDIDEKWKFERKRERDEYAARTWKREYEEKCV